MKKIKRPVNANKTQLMLIFFCIFAILVSISSTSAASTVYVNTTGLDTNLGTAESPFLTIAKGVESVDENGIVSIADGIYSGTGNNQITISRNMTINGQSQTGTIINGTGTWIFDINAEGVTIQNLTLVNGSASSGSAIYINADNVKINDCTFKDNGATYVGGAIFNDYDTTISRCTFINNHANEGGAIYQCDGTLIITNCTFINNTASYQGGAIWIDDETTTTITDCTFTGNSAQYGGAICSPEGDEIILKIIGCTIKDNRVEEGSGEIAPDAVAQGGGIYINPYGDYNYEIIGNHILNNLGSGIYISREGVRYGSTSEVYNKILINFNRIYGNSPYGIYYDTFVQPTATVSAAVEPSTIDAKYNWWGKNSGPNTTGADKTNLDTALYTPWIVMKFSPTKVTLNGGETTELVANFLYDNLGTYHDPANGHIPDGTPVTFTTSLGQVGSQIITKYTINGIATAILMAWNAAGDPVSGIALITATTDAQTFSSSVTMIPVANAASDTVGMQETGLPVAGLVLGILAVFGGLLAPKRK